MPRKNKDFVTYFYDEDGRYCAKFLDVVMIRKSDVDKQNKQIEEYKQAQKALKNNMAK
jgi:hypothetical protein